MLRVPLAMQAAGLAEGAQAVGSEDLPCAEVVQLGGQLRAFLGQQAHHEGEQAHVPATASRLARQAATVA